VSGIAFRLNRPFCFQHHIGTSATGRSGRLTAPLGSLVTFHTAVAVHVTFRVGIRWGLMSMRRARLCSACLRALLKPFHRTVREVASLVSACVSLRLPLFDCDTPVNTLRSLVRL
jgi:hypothetical protein